MLMKPGRNRTVGTTVFGKSQPAGAACGGAQAGTDARGLRGGARRHTPPASFYAQSGREPSGVGRPTSGPVPTGVGGRKLVADRHRRLPRAGRGNSDGVSANPSPALLGAQNAQHFRACAQVRLRRSGPWSPSHLLGGRPNSGDPCLCPLPGALASPLWFHGAAPGARSTRVAVLLRSATALVAEAAYHQCD